MPHFILAGAVRRLGRDITAGIRTGFLWALGYAAYVSLLYVFRGDEPFVKVGMSYLQVVSGYFFAGLTAGAIAGGMRRLGQGLFKRMTIGFIAALPAAFAFLMTIIPPESWRKDLVPVALLSALILGCGIGAAWGVERVV